MQVAFSLFESRSIQRYALIAGAACLVFSGAASAHAATSPEKAPTVASASNAERKFKSLYQREAAFRSKEFPGRIRSDEEDPGFMGDNSDAAEQRRLLVWKKFAAEADKISPAALSTESRVNLQIFINQLRNQINATSLNAHLLTFNSDSQFWASAANMGDNMRCATVAVCQRYLKQLGAISRSFEEKIGLMRLGIARGMTLPRIVLNGRDASIERHIVDQAEKSVFFQAFAKLPESMPSAQKLELQNAAKEMIATKVIPAYRKLLDFIRTEYTPQARTSIAAYDLPNGQAYYRAQILEYTTLEASPEEIHTIGLSEVARIRSDMAKIMADLKFQGDFPAFLRFL
ncbi:MAG: DUF885 family protein, partial [Undibacterium sp.]|nr:DUF885 family protein [Undibacterium sp.]